MGKKCRVPKSKPWSPKHTASFGTWDGGESVILPRESGRDALPKGCASILSRAGSEKKAGEKWASSQWAMKYHKLLVINQTNSSKTLFPENSHSKYYGWVFKKKMGTWVFLTPAMFLVGNHPSLHNLIVFSSKFCSFLCLFMRH